MAGVSRARRRHCRHENFTRLNRRSGYGAGLDLAFTGTGNGTLTDIVVDSQAPAETWTMSFTTATAFTVTGSVSGAQTAGVTGTVYISDSREISFLITVGGVAFVAADAFTFDTDVQAGSVANLNPNDRTLFDVDQAQRLNPTTDGVADLHAAMCADGTSAQTPGARSNQYTFEEVTAASIPGDVGLT